ncbi:MAG TPA: UDP-N-acetylmuramate--L-alanine ligase [Candidatus Paceibacterota bacterium]|nr:UDP-N-acetylmuramate--L-alanine ligase [Candidatus Paceibacterota bacterium]
MAHRKSIHPPVFSSDEKVPRVHLIGIGGIGMSALARYFKSRKWAVSGSDLVESRITRELRKEGISVKIGHAKGNIGPKTSFLVYNRAISRDNPELLRARKLGIPALPYAKVLGDITKRYATIAITGSHGKSTTTALAGLILANAGLDPTVLVGTELKEFGGKNIRIGKSAHMVLEADDFGKAFLDYSPAIAVITNIDREHFDTYPTLAAAKKAFFKFLSRVKNGGVFILNKDDKNLFSLKTQIDKMAKVKNIYALWHSNHGNTAKKIRRIIKIPGEHNISNAIAAYKAGRMLGVPHKKILEAISKYRGAWRRFEFRGDLKIENRKLKIYDDYAHHPTEIKATLAAFRATFPKSKIICVFQPHQARRLKALFKEFQSAFGSADIALIMPVYGVAGRDEAVGRYDSASLVRAMQKRYPKKPIFYLRDPENLKKALKTLLSPADRVPVIVMMGAGDIVRYTDLLLR